VGQTYAPKINARSVFTLRTPEVTITSRKKIGRNLTFDENIPSVLHSHNITQEKSVFIKILSKYTAKLFAV